MPAQRKSKLFAVAPLGPTTECSPAPPRSRPQFMRALAASAAISMLTSLAYLSFRLRSVMVMPRPDSIIWAVFFVEVSTAVPRLFKQLGILGDARRAAAQRIPSQKTDVDDKLPRVDIFVTYCGEGTDIVLNTAKAACVQDFPSDLLRVIVLDDSGSTELESAIFALRNSSKHANLYYASRNIRVSTHSKAANLNFGLSFASTLPGPTPDYFSVLDVDMIPSPHWLRTVLTLLLNDPTAGLACPIQNSYNTYSSDPLGMNHDLAHIECLIRMQSAAQDAWCTGSGWVARRAAVEQIGGIPEWHLQEDVLTSLLLSAAGWKTILAPGALQWGLAADTMASWIKQRQRWAVGLISICRFACSSQARQLPARARLRGFLWGAVDTWASFVWTLSMIVLPLAVMPGKPLLPYHHLGFQLRLAVLDFVAQSLCHYLLSSVLDFRVSILEHVSTIWTAPMRLVIACKHILPSVLGRPLPRFRPTGIPTTGNSERAARKTRTSCLRVVMWDCGAWLHALCLGACLAGVAASFGEVVKVFGRAMCKDGGDVGRSVRTAFDAFIVRIGWPPLFLLLMVLMKNAWIPIAYGISPPPLVDRKELLCESADTGVQYPTESAKREYLKRASEWFWWSVAVFYVVVVVNVEVFNWHAPDPQW